jgi:hypothetical protein
MDLTNPSRPPSQGNTVPSIALAPSVLIRAARGSDGAAIARLAALDSTAVPAGELLVAEADGVLVAARSLATGAVVADPFRPTADIVALLTLRAAAVGAGSDRRAARGLVERLGLRAGRVASRTA